MDFFRVFLEKPLNEKIILYTLNLKEANSIEPDAENYFLDKSEGETVLEASEYFVTQLQKEQLSSSELLYAAIELQKEALWRRIKLGGKLFLRTLTECNTSKIQLWRTIITGELLP